MEAETNVLIIIRSGSLRVNLGSFQLQNQASELNKREQVNTFQVQIQVSRLDKSVSDG